MGYHRAGFEVVGVDIQPQPHYPFNFVQGDALGIAEGSMRLGFIFDAIHASPPCQAYTTMNNRHGSAGPALIADTRPLMKATGLPYVIENVLGARRHLHHPTMLTGEMFGLSVHRPRLFETSFLILRGRVPSRRQLGPVAVYGREDGRRLSTRADGTELHVANLEEGSEAMGIDWMTWDELRQAIPPAYTAWIGERLMDALKDA